MRQIKPISAKNTHLLRQKVLRPHQSLNEMVYPNDDHADSFHLGLFEGDELVGIGSVYHESQKGLLEQREWRLRGMAVDPSQKGTGGGGLILQGLIDHIRSVDGDLVWCNARTTACGFYEKFGFKKFGQEFEITGIGPHYVMVIEL